MVTGGGSIGRVSGGVGARASVGGRVVVMVAVGAAVLALLVPATTAINPHSTLECHRRQYTYKVHKTDDDGRVCWDFINVMSCWGRCDSNEIADWKFPYKRSHHPVCMHEQTQLTEVTLRHCDEDAAPGTEIYSYHDATRCACSVCKSSEASCEGLRYRGARRAPRADVPRG
ncbi:thyrostimulin beta-5 subunit [Procambarus clarkii]|uniref:thyrostimulin beta-5 subunit n=1 Tax=Procambarus clarkii TaxID=6728 RepID=UPI001E678AA2|nr:thyrostimulin beta-5 subunit-like [Procambarus clarkii]